MSVSALLIIASFQAMPAQQAPVVSAQEFVTLMKDRRKILKCFRCEFEGGISASPSGGKLASTLVFTGRHVSRDDGAYLSEVYYQPVGDGPAKREVVTVLNGETSIYYGLLDRPKDGSIEVRRTIANDYFRDGTLSELIAIDYLINLLQYDRIEFESKDREEIEGSECQVVDVITGVGPNSRPELRQINRFWIDFSRQGAVQKIEVIDSNGATRFRFAVESFYDLTIGSEKVSLPETSVLESFLMVTGTREKMQRSISRTPTHRIFTKMLPSTLKVVSKLPDKEFESKYLDGTVVSNKINGSVRELVGSLRAAKTGPVKTRADYDKELQDKLKYAADQASELEMSVPESGEGYWSPWIGVPILITTVPLGIMLLLALKRRVWS